MTTAEQVSIADNQVRGFSWGAVALWTVGTGASWGLGMTPALTIVVRGTPSATATDQVNIAAGIISMAFFCALFAFLSSAAMGAGQRFALQRAFGNRVGDWLPATTIGGTLGWFFGWVAGVWPLSALDYREPESWIVIGTVLGIVAGAIVGLYQWRVLRRWTASTFWLVISTVGWTAGNLTYWLVYRAAGGFAESTKTYYDVFERQIKTVSVTPHSGGAILAGWVIGGLVVGAITGLGLKLLMEKSASIWRVTT